MKTFNRNLKNPVDKPGFLMLAFNAGGDEKDRCIYWFQSKNLIYEKQQIPWAGGD